jgi:hypothetical protein
MNKFITEMVKFKGNRMVPSTAYDFTVERETVALLIKPYTGSTITTAVAGVKTADTSGTIAAGTSNTGQTATQMYTNAKRYVRVTSAATAVSHVGCVLLAFRDRIQPDNSVASYTM